VSAISTVLWDVGGTLLKYAVTSEQFIQGRLAAAGVSLDQLDPDSFRQAEQFRRKWELTWRTVSDESEGLVEYASILLAGTGVSDGTVRQFAASLAEYHDLWAVVPGIPALLADLRDAGILQGVVSNWPPSLRAVLRHHGLDQYFGVIAFSAECGVTKPDARIFLWALAELGVSPGECMFIGDNPDKDIAPARQLGMQTIHFDPQERHPVADARNVDELRRRLRAVLGIAEIA
jgi:putative hydrolase of the HAD superfamily